MNIRALIWIMVITCVAVDYVFSGESRIYPPLFFISLYLRICGKQFVGKEKIQENERAFLDPDYTVMSQETLLHVF
jgi:hypothetical protein